MMVAVFDPLGLGALGCGVLVARYIFARIEKRTVRISDPAAAIRLPNHVDVDRLLFMVFGTEWVVLALFVFADRLPDELKRFVRLGCVSLAVALLLFHVLCVIRLRRLDVFHPRDENCKPRPSRQKRARPGRRAT
jgi:hypothetical protein